MKYSLTLLLFLVVGAAVARAQDTFLKKFEFSSQSFHSEDESDWSGGFAWDLEFGNSFGNTALGEGLDWSLTSSGAIAHDKKLNRTPIIASFDLLHAFTIGREEADQSWPGTGSPDGGFSSPDEPVPFHEMLGNLHLTARYETDQARDHSNGVVSAGLSIINLNHLNLWSFIPTINANVDAVFPDRNVETKSSDAYGRIRVNAFWRIPMTVLGENTLTESGSLNIFAEYTKAFGSSAEKKAGYDDSWGVWAEYVHNLSTGVKEGEEPNSAPAALFVRASFGKFAPVAETDKTILVGLRLGLENLWVR